ncbi:MarR family winged helix-turn-helix transcriptional regulator [Gordonia soli]|uniref:Putative MarR family transcriptional regulator n=1 Tax=Gordonia soli NBRC 108243 TaxID=1223545 RepID=M0QM52_9ACTN|nr:MarR family winged helix-turn-helix transcriptional regulator [Gordonia soli]GAC69494.1 putative MarR family transcriptional regulator [Gordonia soli NBRC 108243]
MSGQDAIDGAAEARSIERRGLGIPRDAVDLRVPLDTSDLRPSADTAERVGPVDSVSREIAEWVDVMDDVDRPVEEARQRIGRLARLFGATMEDIASDCDLSLGDCEALSVIVRAGGRCTPTELGQTLGLTSGTVATRLRRLTAAGSVEADTSAADGRSRPIVVTAAGRERWRAATRRRTDAEAALFATLSSADLDTLNALLRTLLARYEATLGPAPRHDGGRTRGPSAR